jgi:hypothetical protein
VGVSNEGGHVKGAGFRRITIVIAVCALAGAIAGIAGSAAAPSSSSKAQAAKKAKSTAKAKKQAATRQGPRFGFRHFGPGPGPGGPFFGGPGGPVHAEAVVPNADGTGFDTITTDGGILNGVDGTTVDIKEGTDKTTYKDSVKIDVGSDAKVIRNHEDAKLSDLKAGDHVHVIQAPKGNVVLAEDDAFLQQEQKEHERWDRHRGFGAPVPPPPGAPGAPGGDNQNGSDSGSAPGGNTNS